MIRYWIIALLALGLCGMTGCVSKNKARAQASDAFATGQSQAIKQMQPQQAVVTVMGEVRNHTIPWKEGLTLAMAIDAAQYTGFNTPRIIVLKREDESVRIKVSDLTRGTVNPELVPGDVVEIQR